MNGMNKEENHRMKESARLYQKGIISLQEAATAAKVSIYEMMEFTEKHQIYPKELSEQEMEEHFEYAKKILKKD